MRINDNEDVFDTYQEIEDNDCALAQDAMANMFLFLFAFVASFIVVLVGAVTFPGNVVAISRPLTFTIYIGFGIFEIALLVFACLSFSDYRKLKYPHVKG